jgi:hypothetical protein
MPYPLTTLLVNEPMVDDWVLFGDDDRVVKISMEKIPEPWVLDTRVYGDKSGVDEP